MNAGGIDSGRIQSMLAQLKAAAERPHATSGSAAIGGLNKADHVTKTGFADALKSSIEQVNQTQLSAEALGKSFAMGDDSVSLSDVMIAGQKANISFQAAVQVRNKLVSAYHDIMNMQV
jgi:flagellar hook-basal body complex protein FliE